MAVFNRSRLKTSKKLNHQNEVIGWDDYCSSSVVLQDRVLKEVFLILDIKKKDEARHALQIS
jgi:hypothetical protein